MAGNTSGWNRPSSADQPKAKKGGAKAPSVVRGIVAGLAVAIIAGVCVFMFAGKSEKSVEKVEKKPTKIKEVTPALAPTNAVLAEASQSRIGVVKKLEVPKVHPEYPRTNADGSVTKIMKDGTTYTVLPRSKNWAKKHPFKHKLEMQLSWYVMPGEEVPPMLPISYTDKEVMDALLDKVEISPDDDDDMVMRKEAVQEIKGELRKWIKDGGDVEGFIRELARRQALEADALKESRKMIIDEIKKGDYETAKGLRDRLNDHLKSKGLPSVKIPKVYRQYIEPKGSEK